MKLLLVLLLFCAGQIHAQTVIEGQIKDESTREPIAYVNIGVINKNNGTVTSAEGYYRLNLPESLDEGTIRISIIGYESRTFKVSDFRKTVSASSTLYLRKSVSELREVMIPSRKMKPGKLGNELGYRPASAGFANNVLGNEIGIPIKIKHKPTFVEAFNAVLDYNHHGQFTFRLNFYDMKDGLPGNSILDESIIVRTSQKKGVLTVDLRDYNIVVTQDFFVSIELIEGLGEGGLHFLADYDGPPVITRSASQGKWNKQKSLSFGFSVTVLH